MIYALGRGVDYYDMPSVRSVVRRAASRDYRMSEILLGIVQSTPFQMKRATPVDLAMQPQKKETSR